MATSSGWPSGGYRRALAFWNPILTPRGRSPCELYLHRFAELLWHVRQLYPLRFHRIGKLHSKFLLGRGMKLGSASNRESEVPSNSGKSREIEPYGVDVIVLELREYRLAGARLQGDARREEGVLLHPRNMQSIQLFPATHDGECCFTPPGDVGRVEAPERELIPDRFQVGALREQLRRNLVGGETLRYLSPSRELDFAHRSRSTRTA